MYIKKILGISENHNKNKHVIKKYKFVIMETIKEENRILLYMSEKYYFITNDNYYLII